MTAAPRPWLVLGGSGAVGRFLLRELARRGQPTLALSRQAPPSWARDWPGIEWRRGALEDSGALLREAAVLLSAGPLDAFASACTRYPPSRECRVVALSSLSVVWKRASPDPGERALVERLVRAEEALLAACADLCHGPRLLRVGLIYGAGIDRSLQVLLNLARRLHGLPWPRGARGRRQPVHAEDLARAMLAAAHREAPPTHLALPGPEAVPFDVLIDRMLAAAAPGLRRWPLPLPRGVSDLAARHVARLAPLARAYTDQCAAADDWQRLGLVPRDFNPTPLDFVAWS